MDLEVLVGHRGHCLGAFAWHPTCPRPKSCVQALDTNAITGSLPAMWAALGSLRELRLRNNRLSGKRLGKFLPTHMVCFA